MSEPLRVQFQCTYADFRESNRGHLAAQRPSGKPRRIWSSLAGWLVFVALAVALMFLVQSTNRPSVAPVGPATPTIVPVRTVTSIESVTLPDGWALVVRFFDASVFSLMFCVMYAVLLTRTALRQPRPAWLPPAAAQRWMRFLLLAFLGIAGFLVVRAVNPDGSPGSTRSPSGYERLLSVGPCLLLLLILIAFSVSYRRLELKRRWSAQPFLHRPYTLEADDAGITLDEPKSTHRYHWDYYPGFRETLNTLMLYVSPYGFWIIPKRAFASTEELEAFKALLLTHIKTGILLPTATAGFPIKLLPSQPVRGSDPAEVARP